MNRRSVRAAFLGAALLAGAGCGTVHFDVPEGARVKLLDADTPAEVRVERTVWYAIWGAVELGDTHTAPLIEENHLVAARFHTQYNAWDAIINTFTNLLSFSRRRIIVEGIPAKEKNP
jgi:hypothetical protein